MHAPDDVPSFVKDRFNIEFKEEQTVMKTTTKFILVFLVVTAGIVFGDFERLGLAMPFVFAHCDTMDGPVITEARKSLETGDITPLLKWVRAEDEDVVKETFEKALSVRKLSPEAAEVADRLFFETLVRVHRAAEGAPFTGLKPVGTGISPAEMAADRALEEGSVDSLAGKIAGSLEKEIRARFDRVMEKKKHAEQNVRAGREYVEAYVRYVHFVDGVHNMISGHGGGHGHGEQAGGGHGH